MPTSEDPFGDYDHLVPVPLEQAAKELQQATGRAEHLTSALRFREKAKKEIEEALAKAQREEQEKRHLLYLSAMHAYIPPKVI